MEGTVKWYNERKGYGFIEGEDGQDYFVHESAIEKGAYVHDNDPVTFEPVKGDRGMKAEQVVLKK